MWWLMYTLCYVDIFAHNILIKIWKDIDNYEPWVSMTNQGKLLKNLTRGMLWFFKSFLGWSIEILFAKYLVKGCTTQILWCAQNIFLDLQVPKLTYFYLVQSVFLSSNWSDSAKILGFVCHVKSFRGPYVVHAWSSVYRLNLELIIP